MLLTATSADVLLPTIVSRCETISLRAVPGKEIEAQLREAGHDPETVKLAARLSFGLPGIATQLVNNPELLELRRERLQELMRLMSENRAERFRFAAQHTRGRDYRAQRQLLMEILETWLSLLRDVLLKSLEVDFQVRNPDWVEEIEAMAVQVDPSFLLTAVKATERTLHAIDQNANLQLALENLMLDLPGLSYSKT
jgi:DNA polymerase-3 subunit delta'